jgi:hypothetical protein
MRHSAPKYSIKKRKLKINGMSDLSLEKGRNCVKKAKKNFND